MCGRIPVGDSIFFFVPRSRQLKLHVHPAHSNTHAMSCTYIHTNKERREPIIFNGFVIYTIMKSLKLHIALSSSGRGI